MTDPVREEFEKWCPITITDEAKAPKSAALVKAYWNAWQAAAALYREKWVSVEERLPGKGEMVLVAWSDGQIEINWMMTTRWYKIPASDKISIAHWMPLPDPPEAK